MNGAAEERAVLSENNRFIKSTFNRHLFPAVFSVMGVTVSTMANNLIAGSLLGPDALAVMSLISPVYFIFATLGSLIGVGGAAAAAGEIGAGSQAGADAAFTLSAVLSLGAGGLATAAGLAFIRPLLHLLGTAGPLYEMAFDYSFLFIAGGTATTAIYLPFNFLKLAGRLRLSAAIFFMMAVLNVSLDLLFVKAFHMGILGISLGTTLATAAAAAVGWSCLFSRVGGFRLTGLRGVRAFLHGSRTLALKGSPAALNNLLTVLRTVLLNQMAAAAASSAGLSAFGIVSTVGNLALTVISGVSQATVPFIGVFWVERDNSSIRQLEKQALLKGEGLTALFSAAVIVMAEPICRLFGVSQARGLAVAVPAVRLFAVSLVFSMAANLLVSYYLAAGRTGLANLTTFCRALLFVALPARALLPVLGINSVWLSFTWADVLTFCALAAVLAVYRRKKPALSGILLLDRNSERNGRSISFTVKSSVESIMEGSEKIAQFCEQNHLDVKRSMLISLSLEEMLISIRDHSFMHTQEAPINVRILLQAEPNAPEKQTVILRIRCSGEPFDPIAYYEAHSDGELSEEDDSLGIRMIVAAARRVDYKSTFGVNNLTVLL